MFQRIVFCVAVYPALVAGWGGNGHRIITELATDLMSGRAKIFVSNTLGGEESEIEASLWADSLDAKSRYPQSWSYHFSHTPAPTCGPFDIKRDCGFGKTRGLCIVTALVDAIIMSADINASQENRKDALKFVLHLVGDLHQPLHTGFREDSGGLRIGLGVLAGMNLHELWDTWMIDQYWSIGARKSVSSSSTLRLVVDRLVSNSEKFGQIGDRIDSTMTDFEISLNSQSKLLQAISAIASETTQSTCSHAYTNPLTRRMMAVGDRVGIEYFRARVGVLETQLISAGIRLARIVDAIANVYQNRRLAERSAVASRSNSSGMHLFEKRESVCAATLNSFAALAFDFDVDAIATDISELGPTRPPLPPPSKIRRQRASRGLAKKTDDNDLIERAIAESDRASYVFGGVDLSIIKLFKIRGGRLVVSSAQFVQRGNKFDEPKLSNIKVINFEGANAEEKRIEMNFDYRVFPSRNLTEEVIIRSILKLKGIDPRIDLTDFYDGSIGDIVIEDKIIGPRDDPRILELERQSAERFLSFESTCSALKMSGKKVPKLLGQLKKRQHEICTYDINDQFTVYILCSSLVTAGDRVLLHAFTFGNAATKQTHTVALDPQIFPGIMEWDEVRPVERLLVKTRTANKQLSITTAARDRPSWGYEIEELRTLLESNVENPIGYYLNQVLLYRGETMERFRVLEWVRTSHATDVSEPEARAQIIHRMNLGIKKHILAIAALILGLVVLYQVIY